MHGDKPLMEALALRSTSRAFASDPLPMQTLSNLLWAAWGINRPDKGLRTAPSAVNWQETDVHVVMESGAYVYNAKSNTLEPVATGDYRAMTGTQFFVNDAPITLVFVADASRMKSASEDTKVPLQWATRRSSARMFTYSALLRAWQPGFGRVLIGERLEMR